MNKHHTVNCEIKSNINRADSETCFDCVYGDIRETGHEWIECKCKLTNKWCSPYRACEEWKNEC